MEETNTAQVQIEDIAKQAGTTPEVIIQLVTELMKNNYEFCDQQRNLLKKMQALHEDQKKTLKVENEHFEEVAKNHRLRAEIERYEALKRQPPTDSRPIGAKEPPKIEKKSWFSTPKF